MGDDTSKTQDKKKVSILEAFELSELLPGGVAFEIKQLEALKDGAMTDGDVSTIYTMVLQGIRMAKNQLPEGFNYPCVRSHYGL